MVRAPDGVFIMLDDQQRVALFFQLLQRMQKNLVVARMQADGRFVQDVANPAQVGAELRSQPDALRLAAGQRRRRTIQRQVIETDFRQKAQAVIQFRQQVARNLQLAAFEPQCRNQFAELCDRQHAVVGDRAAAPQHRERLAIEPLAPAIGARLIDLQPFDPRVQHIVLGTGARTFLVPAHFFDLQSGAIAGGAPTVPGVVGKQARIEFRKTARARRTGTLGREHGLGNLALALHQAVERRDHMRHALAVLQRQLQAFAQHLFVRGTDMQVRDRQFD